MDCTIAFCTVVKNRAHHLKDTLIKNIRDNLDYPLCSFIVLDYNSEDDLEAWLRQHCQEFITSGRLIYYKTFRPKSFHRSHSRNVVFRLAQAEILCNVDADNFIGRGFANYINQSYQNNKNCFLVVDYTSKELHYFKGSMGRICVRKNDYLRIRGFDEFMEGYGFEDMDLIKRLEKAGVKKKFIDNSDFLQTIPHDDVQRISDEDLYKSFKHVLIKYDTFYRSDLLFLGNEGTCQWGTIVDNYNESTQTRENVFSPIPKYAFDLYQANWINGNWIMNDRGLCEVNLQNSVSFRLQSTTGEHLEFREETGNSYYEITDPYVVNTLLKFHPEIRNRNQMLRNLKSDAKLNPGGFGNDRVFKNFDYENEIVL